MNREMLHDYMHSLCIDSNVCTLRKLPRVLVIVAHPDDEIIGMGSCLSRIGDLTLVHMTDGSPVNLTYANVAGFTTKEEYAKTRFRELHQALSIAGVPNPTSIELGFNDQEVAFNLIECINSVVGIIQECNPSIIFTHAYEGGHPDHDSISLAVWVACRILRTQQKCIPVHLEFASYHGKNGVIITYTFLPDNTNGRTWIVQLDESKKSLKEAMFDCFTTQREMLRMFPLQIEKYRKAPEYNYSIPPHDGELFYETYQFGLKGSEWRNLAMEAMVHYKFGDLL